MGFNNSEISLLWGTKGVVFYNTIISSFVGFSDLNPKSPSEFSYLVSMNFRKAKEISVFI